MIKAVIFDMDGTVIDSTESDYLAWKKVFEEYEVDFSYQEYQKVLGAQGSEIVPMYLAPSVRQEALDKKEYYFKALVEERGLNFVPGVESLLEAIKDMNIKTSLATGAGKDKLTFIFEQVKMKEYFDVVITADDTKTGKPAPDVFLNSARRLNILPSDCVVFEDAENGVKAAKAGGMKCVAITTTHEKKKLQEADLIIRSYSEFDMQKFFGIF